MSNDIFVDGDPLEDPHWQKTKKPKRSGPLIGCPVPWFVWVLPLVKTKNQLAMVFYLYRRCCVCNSDTVTVPNDEVKELLDISRWGKRRYLVALEQAGILRIRETGRRMAKVQLCYWPDPPR
jgi:hypothetical protein